MTKRNLIAINGRWLEKPTSGTSRFSGEIAKQLLDLFPDSYELVIPAKAVPPSWSTTTTVRQSQLGGVLFDQVAFPFMTFRQRTLVMHGPAVLAKSLQTVVIHDVGFRHFPQHYKKVFNFFYTLLYSKALRSKRNQILTVSEFSKIEIDSTFKRHKGKEIFVVPCSGDHILEVASVRPESYLPNQFVLFVGPPSERKNSKWAIQALAAAGYSVVVVVGAGTPMLVTSNLSKQNGVFLLDYVSDEEMRWLFENAAVFVFPSQYEGFGIPVIEAQTLGCRVLVSQIPSLHEVTGGTEGYLTGRAEDLIQQVSELISRQVSSTELTSRAANATRYSWRASALKIHKQMTGLGLD